MEKGLLEKTGRSLEEWIKEIRKHKLEKHGEIMKFLKSEHNFTHGFANFVTLKARGADAGSSDAASLVKDQYKNKESLHEIYQILLEKVKNLGSDIEIAPKKKSVSVRRKRQFLLIQPSTKTRMDLGLKFNNKPIAGRLENSGIFGAMCTHRVQVTAKEEINQELLDWIKEAYLEAV